MLFRKDSTDIERLERFAKNLKSSIGGSIVKRHIKVAESVKVDDTDTDGGLITLARWPEVNAEIQV
jgi:hypothetical protein